MSSPKKRNKKLSITCKQHKAGCEKGITHLKYIFQVSTKRIVENRRPQQSITAEIFSPKPNRKPICYRKSGYIQAVPTQRYVTYFH